MLRFLNFPCMALDSKKMTRIRKKRARQDYVGIGF